MDHSYESDCNRVEAKAWPEAVACIVLALQRLSENGVRPHRVSRTQFSVAVAHSNHRCRENSLLAHPFCIGVLVRRSRRRRTLSPSDGLSR